jgi:hypothetical protein
MGAVVRAGVAAPPGAVTGSIGGGAASTRRMGVTAGRPGVAIGDPIDEQRRIHGTLT